jgi:hypothetical protein
MKLTKYSAMKMGDMALFICDVPFPRRFPRPTFFKRVMFPVADDILPASPASD